MEGFQLSSNPLSNPNKHLKEQFVSNLTGSSMLEIAVLSFIAPALVVLRQWTAGLVDIDASRPKKSDDRISPTQLRKSYVLSVGLDFLFVVLPILAVLTVLADWIYAFATLLAFLLLSVLVARRSQFNAQVTRNSTSRANILSYRVAMMVVTCMCILAVDFRIFPRRYAKTETYGTGLMDIGVGSFVVANSLVSRQARNIMPKTWTSTLTSTGPLLFLGFVRLLSTTGVNYQVHVGEYGVHWNFFFTLAAVSLLTSFINIRPWQCGLCALLILTAYQTCLSYGLNNYLLSSDRSHNLISQNKEGLFSVFGYWGMYLGGVFLGYQVFFAEFSTTGVWSEKVKVWVLTFFFWMSTLFLDKYVERVSRRMCNLGYVSLVFAQNFEVLSVLMMSDFIPGQRPLILEEAFNQNLLGSFLVANLLTGFVNLFVDTLAASSVASFCILLGYSLILSCSVSVAGYLGLKMKFW